MIKWKTFEGLYNYETSIKDMEILVKKIVSGKSPEQIWLLQYESLYTGGTSAKEKDILGNAQFPIHKVRRGGQFTYHGPGQRVIYPILDLRKLRKDVRYYIWLLEEWIIKTISKFKIEGRRHHGRVGVWVNGIGGEKKIAAIGVRITKWIASHGVSVNLNPDLSNYSGIVPCGISDQGITSFSDLGISTTISEFDNELKRTFNEVFKRL